MRRPSSTATLALAVFLAASLATLGCASRKRVSVDTPPPPPPPTETETPPPPPPSSTGGESSDTQSSALQDAFFDYDDASLRSDAKAALEANAKYLDRSSGTNVVVEGHCDERGSVEYNLALGERRARAAKEFLVSYGVAGNRLTTISYGKERPFDPGHDESAWAKNRRAHFVAQ